MKTSITIFALAAIGAAQAQTSPARPAGSEPRARPVVERPAGATQRPVRQRVAANEVQAPQPTFLDRSKPEYFEQIPLFRDAPTFRTSQTQSVPPSTTEGLAEALGLTAR